MSEMKPTEFLDGMNRTMRSKNAAVSCAGIIFYANFI